MADRSEVQNISNFDAKIGFALLDSLRTAIFCEFQADNQYLLSPHWFN